MTDRELLELAAKAASIKLVWHGDTDPWCYAETSPGIKWNPLTDDGDAFRLMVKVGRLPEFWEGLVVVADEEEWRTDPLAATRRAITRAAAEIGRSMP